VGSTFGFGPGDLGLIPRLRVTFCFLPHWIRSTISWKGGPPTEYQLYGKPWTILKADYWLSDIFYVKQDDPILTRSKSDVVD